VTTKRPVTSNGRDILFNRLRRRDCQPSKMAIKSFERIREDLDLSAYTCVQTALLIFGKHASSSTHYLADPTTGKVSATVPAENQTSIQNWIFEVDGKDVSLEFAVGFTGSFERVITVTTSAGFFKTFSDRGGSSPWLPCLIEQVKNITKS